MDIARVSGIPKEMREELSRWGTHGCLCTEPVQGLAAIPNSRHFPTPDGAAQGAGRRAMTRPRTTVGKPCGDAGQVTAMVVVMMTALILLAGLVLDGGLTLAARERALGLAQQAARAGAQAVNLAVYRQDGTLALQPARAVADARAYLASTGSNGTVSVAGNTVTVTVSITQPMQLLQIAGLHAITVHASASAVPERGIVAISGGFANSEGLFAVNSRMVSPGG